jgi:phenylpropionate dioxygenase-like ring-hydroxylating dioxygenase large terminal subunit
MLLRNVWYVAAFSNELKVGEPLGRTYLGEPVALFRTESGKVKAVLDRCSHRAMPLSEGHVDGEVIRCPYHGMEFGGDGVCKRIPGQDRISANANIRAFPIHETDNMIWIWMGDPALADPEKIIGNPEHVDPKWTWKNFYFHVEADWQLLVDNILDLTHLPYIHANTIGGNPEQHYNAEMEVIADGERVELLRKLPNSIPPKSYIDAGGFKGRVDRWQEVRFHPEMGMVMRVNAGGCDAGTGAYEGKRDHGFMLANIHCITPETETSLHYIWSIATTASPESGVPEVLFDQFFDTITEDEETIAKQQKNINRFPDKKFMGIANDGAVNQGRRLLSKLYEREQDALSAVK